MPITSIHAFQYTSQGSLPNYTSAYLSLGTPHHAYRRRIARLKAPTDSSLDLKSTALFTLFMLTSFQISARRFPSKRLLLTMSMWTS
uniref:ARAD1C00110p n=1 Tax=Blastobotrys adeninivorans TaxID=409370 RepID=A0A060SYV1_BLAAD